MATTRNNFTELEDLLKRLGAPVGASECHGFICAQLCTSEQPETQAWRECLGIEGEEVEATLKRVSETSARELAASDFIFEPLLPSDEATLTLRADALAAWCRGFLFGLGTGGLTEAGLSGDSRELVEDMTRISRAGAEPEQNEEFALQELVEYVRAGTMSIYQELQPLRGDARAQQSLH